MTPGGGRPRQVLAAVMAGAVLGPIDGSIVNVVLPTLVDSFGASLASVQWVPMAYLLASGGLVLVFGRLGDLRGHRGVFLGGLLAFVAASALCAAAPTIEALVAFRVLQGVASAAMTSVPLAILTATFPPVERGRAIGLFAASISVGLAIGPSLGGFLTATFGWRAVFLVNLPIGLAAWVYARRVLPEVPIRPGRLDLPGAAAALVALGSALLWVNLAQRPGPAPHGLLLLALLAGAAFLLRERHAAEPMVALSLFRSGAGPGRVGLVLTASPLAVLAVAPFAGALSDRIGSVRPAVAGSLLSAAACALLAAMPRDSGPLAVAVRLALFGVGTGLFQSPNNSSVMGSAPREHLGVVGSLLGTARTLGMVLGIAAAGAVLYAFVPPSALGADGTTPSLAAELASGVRRAYAAGAGFALLSAALAAAPALARRVGRTGGPAIP